MSLQTPTVVSARRSPLRRPRLLRSTRGVIGVAIFAFVLAVALLGPVIAPYPLDRPIGAPGAPPGGNAPLGTDFLGRDVLSRLLHGGFSVLLLSVASVALTYVIGITVGMVSGFLRSWLDPVLMRVVDLFIAVPPLLLVLVLVSGAGTSSGVLIIGTAAVLFPGVARIVRTATLEVSTAGYVEAAIARGERTISIMRRDILPNIAPSLIADAGVRSLGAIYLIASLNFLGFGAQPPAANWGLMVAENDQVISTNIWAVLAPALMIALLAISVNLIGDAYLVSMTRSEAQ